MSYAPMCVAKENLLGAFYKIHITHLCVLPSKSQSESVSNFHNNIPFHLNLFEF